MYCLHHSEKMRLDISCKLSAFFQLKCNIFMKIGYGESSELMSWLALLPEAYEVQGLNPSGLRIQLITV